MTYDDELQNKLSHHYLGGEIFYNFCIDCGILRTESGKQSCTKNKYNHIFKKINDAGMFGERHDAWKCIKCNKKANLRPKGKSPARFCMPYTIYKNDHGAMVAKYKKGNSSSTGIWYKDILCIYSDEDMLVKEILK